MAEWISPVQVGKGDVIVICPGEPGNCTLRVAEPPLHTTADPSGPALRSKAACDVATEPLELGCNTASDGDTAGITEFDPSGMTCVPPDDSVLVTVGEPSSEHGSFPMLVSMTDPHA
jgi:hypothetical protein